MGYSFLNLKVGDLDTTNPDVPPTPAPSPTPPAPSPPAPSPPSPSGCPGGSLSACEEACAVVSGAAYDACVSVCKDECPSTTTPAPAPSPPAPTPPAPSPPAPTPVPSDCPGGSLQAC